MRSGRLQPLQQQIPQDEPQSSVTQVSLVHASDSIRTVPQATQVPTPFVSAWSRMTRPPVRVVAQPQRVAQPPQHAISTPILLSSKASSIPLPTLSVLPMAGRPYNELVEVAEQQRKQLIAIKNEEERRSVMQRENGIEAARRLHTVKREVADEEGEFRRLSELERETRGLQRRNAERETELEQLTGSLQEQQKLLRAAANRVETLRRQLDVLYARRQAATNAALAEQSRMQQQAKQQMQIQQQQQQMMNRSMETQSHAQPVAQSVPMRVPAINQHSEVVRPRASVEPFQVVVPKTEIGIQIIKKQEEPIIPKITPEVIMAATNREDISPSPPKDPHPTEDVELDSVDGGRPQENSVKSREPQHIYSFAPTNELPQVVIERPSNFGESLDESKLRTGKTDLVSLRNDSLKAAKRRSWAASEGTSLGEADTIRRILEDQRKGRNHFIPDLPTEQSIPEVSTELELDKELPNLRIPTTDEESSSAKSDEESVEMEITTRRQVKGIVRQPGLKKGPGRHIEFDPLALILDAALEGELDLVKASAAKLTDVSVANDEGITALHNAICAGHYEIVRFLIEALADVNAHDSDGWTPLHCAASCNNLPMVRQLVEGGACVLASTQTDMETPVEKCEEDEEGYVGCMRYLMAAHQATGSMNDGKVYAAYDYEAEFEDELSFQAGDELKVTGKDDVEKHWWTCERINPETKEVETGLVPRTYLALYPALKYRKQLNFIMFDLPQEPNNNELE